MQRFRKPRRRNTTPRTPAPEPSPRRWQRPTSRPPTAPCCRTTVSRLPSPAAAPSRRRPSQVHSSATRRSCMTATPVQRSPAAIIHSRDFSQAKARPSAKQPAPTHPPTQACRPSAQRSHRVTTPPLPAHCCRTTCCRPRCRVRARSPRRPWATIFMPASSATRPKLTMATPPRRSLPPIFS